MTYLCSSPELSYNFMHVFSPFIVVSASLSLGLIIGFCIVQSYAAAIGMLTESCAKENKEKIALRKQRQAMMEGMYLAQVSPDDDPASFRVRSDNSDGSCSKDLEYGSPCKTESTG